jgi:hypothetical protein
MPDELTVAIDGLSELHVPPEHALDSVSVDPTHTLSLPPVTAHCARAELLPMQQKSVIKTAMIFAGNFDKNFLFIRICF